MDFWITFIVWLAVSALLLFGWVYKLGKYRELTKETFFTLFLGGGALALAVRFRLPLWGAVALAAAAVAYMCVAMLTRLRPKMPKWANTPAATVLLVMVWHALGYHAGLPRPAALGCGVAVFLVAYGLLIYRSNRLRLRNGE